MGLPFGFGARFLYDSHLGFWRPGLPTFLRVRNFVVPSSGFSELGFELSVPPASGSGFTDVPVKPQPEVMEVPLRDIGLNQARLMFGARKFAVSHTFVLKRMIDQGFTDPYKVWRDPTVIGLFYNSRLFSIESVTHDEYAGQTLVWSLLCNSTETQVTVQGS